MILANVILMAAAIDLPHVEMLQRGAFDIHCEPLITEGRSRIRALMSHAADVTDSESRKCAFWDAACKGRVRSRIQQFDIQIRNAQSALKRQIDDCARSILADAAALTHSPKPCQALVDYSRNRIGTMQNRAKQDRRSSGQACGRNLNCHGEAKKLAASQGRRIQVEQASLTRQIRDCEDSAEWTQPTGDWDPLAPGISPRLMSTRDGDWYPDPCQGFIEFARERMHKLRNQADEAYKVDRINCAGNLACLDLARRYSAERSAFLRNEQARLRDEIGRCQARNPAPR